MATRKRLIDDRDQTERMADLQAICPWIPQFTPQAADSHLKKPPKRPSSPMTSHPLRVSDLIPVNLMRETESAPVEGHVKFICAVSRSYIYHITY